MSEYTSDPAAVAQYYASRARTANWIESLATKTPVSPSVAPSLVSDTDDGIDSPDDDSDAESSHSLPPRMVLRWPDGRPDIPVSHAPHVPSQWTSPHKPQVPQTSPSRSRTMTQPPGYPPSNPYITTHPPSVGSALYIPPPPPPALSQQPETIQIHPSPTSVHPPPSQYPPPHLQYRPDSLSSRSRSMRSAGSAHAAQMIYTPPPPASPARPIASPSPVYAFATAQHATLDAVVEAGGGDADPMPTPPYPPRSHSSAHSYSQTYGSSSAHRSHTSSSSQRPPHSSSHHTPHQSPTHHSSSHHSSSHQSSHPHRSRQPPAIIYAPSNHASNYAYNPPRIISASTPNSPAQPYSGAAHPPPHAPRRLGPSISDPNPRRPASRGRLFEQFSRTPSPASARRLVRGRGKQRDDSGSESVSSASTYYVMPSHGQKVLIVPPAPALNQPYPSPTSPTSPSRSRWVPNNPYLPTPAPASPTPKRPLLQRLLHPQLGGGNANGGSANGDSGRRMLRRPSEGSNRF